MLSSSLNQLHFEGPFKLKQGGISFAGRFPILQQDTLWGFAAVIIRKENFIKTLGLNQTDFATGVSVERYHPIGD